MVRFDLYLTQLQREALSSASETTGLTAAEILRRLIDYGTQERVMNEIVPNVSGHISLRR